MVVKVVVEASMDAFVNFQYQICLKYGHIHLLLHD